MEMIKDYQGFTRTIDSSGKFTTEVYKGFKADCEKFMAEYKRGQYGEYGSLLSIELRQSDGPYWTVTLEWSIEYDNGGNDSPTGASYGPKASSLTIRMLSLPIESRWNYRTNWNYNLASLGERAKPEWWEYTDKLKIENADDAKVFKWIKEPSELPPPENGKKWVICEDWQKPGVETYSKPIYEITETSKHLSKNQAGWAVANVAGKIAFPENGDFGIQRKMRWRLAM